MKGSGAPAPGTDTGEHERALDAPQRATGAGRRHDADALLVHALILAIGFGLLFTTGVLLLGPVALPRSRR